MDAEDIGAKPIRTGASGDRYTALAHLLKTVAIRPEAAPLEDARNFAAGYAQGCSRPRGEDFFLGVSSMRKVSVAIGRADVVGETDRRLFGAFVEHVGRSIYGGRRCARTGLSSSPTIGA